MINKDTSSDSRNASHFDDRDNDDYDRDNDVFDRDNDDFDRDFIKILSSYDLHRMNNNSHSNDRTNNNNIFSIDISYLRDLQLSISQILLLKLYEQAEIFDRKVKQLELQCAKLMTLLKISYHRAKVYPFCMTQTVVIII